MAKNCKCLQVNEEKVFDRHRRLSHYVHPTHLFQSTVVIFDAKGKQIGKVRGAEQEEYPVWQIPRGLKGQFTAEIKLRTDGRIDRAKDVAFAVE